MSARFMLRIATTLLALGAVAAHAGDRQATVTTGNGKTWTRNVDRSDGHVTDTTTAPDGQTRVRTVARSASQTTASITGFNGKTVETRTTERTASGSTSTITGRKGRTGTVVIEH